MKTFPKILITVLATISAFYFVFWIPGTFLRLALPENDFSWVIVVIFALVVASAVAVVLWKVLSSSSKGALVETAKWAGIVGGIGFIAGFVGPILLTPSANQGPLLGLFITGPGGVLLGGIGGFCKWYFKDRKTSNQ